MKVLKVFQEAQMAKTEVKLSKRMAPNEEKREKCFHELKKWLKIQSDRMMAAIIEAKKLKTLHPPIKEAKILQWKWFEHYFNCLNSH